MPKRRKSSKRLSFSKSKKRKSSSKKLVIKKQRVFEIVDLVSDTDDEENIILNFRNGSKKHCDDDDSTTTSGVSSSSSSSGSSSSNSSCRSNIKRYREVDDDTAILSVKTVSTEYSESNETDAKETVQCPDDLRTSFLINFNVGDSIRITGLVYRKELNGTLATYMGLVERRGQYQHKVRLFNYEKEIVYLAEENLIGMNCTKRAGNNDDDNPNYVIPNRVSPFLRTVSTNRSRNSPETLHQQPEPPSTPRPGESGTTTARIVTPSRSGLSTKINCNQLSSFPVYNKISPIPNLCVTTDSHVASNHSVTIPSSRAGEFIGHSGINMKQVREYVGGDTSIELEVHPVTDQQPPYQRRLFITGPLVKVEIVLDLVKYFLESPPMYYIAKSDVVQRTWVERSIENFEKTPKGLELTKRTKFTDRINGTGTRIVENKQETRRNNHRRFDDNIGTNNNRSETVIPQNVEPSDRLNRHVATVHKKKATIERTTVVQDSSKFNNNRNNGNNNNNNNHPNERINQNGNLFANNNDFNRSELFQFLLLNHICFKCTVHKFYTWLRSEGIYTIGEIKNALHVPNYVKTEMQVHGLKSFQVDGLRRAALSSLR